MDATGFAGQVIVAVAEQHRTVSRVALVDEAGNAGNGTPATGAATAERMAIKLAELGINPMCPVPNKPTCAVPKAF